MGLPFQLRCLGRPQLISPGGEPVRFRVRKHLALLTYLALEPRFPHRRDKLADLLWGSAPPNEGRHSLATAASMIRGKLGREALEGDRDHLRLSATNLSIDLERLAAGALFGDEYTPALDVGGFLEDFEVVDALEFMLWTERQRARWLPLVRDALVRLIDRCRRTGDFKQIEKLGNSLLEIDELSEDGIRAKMEARAFDGDRLTSLKIYEAWRTKLANELQALPSPLVEGIAIRLRRRDWESTTSNIPTVPTDQWRGRPFVGRAAEYRALYESWEKTLQRYPHHALIIGDSGVGKSTLLERVVTAAGLEGGAISRVGCYELEREIPYAAIGGLITGLLDRPGASGTPPEWLAELSRTVPEIRRRFPSIPDPIETQGETARIRLTEAVQQLALSIAEEHPVILVIDDVHLADDASLAVLHLLIRRTLDQRIMVLLAARPAELGQSPHAVWLRDGHEQLRMQLLDLQPMTSKECEELLASLLSDDTHQPSAPARRALVQAAAGFPMVLEYLVNDWRSNGDQCLALSIGAMTEEPRTASAPNQTYHLIVQRLVQSLDPSVRNVLNMASVLGARMNDIEMYRVADVSIGQTMTALGKLTDMRILRDGSQGLEFCNELVRGEAYLGVPSPVRRTLHRSIAERLVHHEAEGLSIPGLEIAWHSIRGGLLDSATPYLLRGAREAIRRGAPHEAERALETALGHLAEPARTDALLLLAEALHEQGKWERVLESTKSCVLLTSDPRNETALALALEPRFRLGLTGPRSVDDIANEVGKLAYDGTDPRARIRAIKYVAHVLVSQREVRLASLLGEMLEQSMTVNLGIEDLANLSLARAILHYHKRDLDSAKAELRTTLRKLDQSGVGNLASTNVRLGLANLHSSSGDYESAAESNMEAFKSSELLGNDRQVSRIAANISLCMVRLGNYASAIEWGRRSYELYRAFNFDFRPYALYHVGVALAMVGRTDDAMKTVEMLVSVARLASDKSLQQNALLYVADVEATLGHQANALKYARAATGHGLGLLYKNSAGIYGRWSSVVQAHDFSVAAARLSIVGLLQSLDEYDSIDQAEVVCASVWLDYKAGLRNQIESDKLLALLAKLPPAVTDQLRRADFLKV
jgi:DNA-binding SARP family transcriptional activator/tetratricopeptide (TPR) repeat protein